MKSKEREALKLALEALKQIDEAMPFPVAKLAIKKAEEALAQPEQEPLATPLPCDVKVGHVTIRKGVALSVLIARMQVLYDMAQSAMAQPEQEPVEDLQAKLKWATEQLDANINWEFVASAKEAMLQAAWAEIKELREQTKELREQEPVAIVEASWNDDEGFMLVKRLAEKLPKGTKLYTTPPQRPSRSDMTWVGLTEEDWDYLNKYCGSTRNAIQTAETLLKEKNT